jgi:hypothetical protein
MGSSTTLRGERISVVTEHERDLLHLRADVERCGRERIIREVLKHNDAATFFGLLEALNSTSPESIDLMTAFILVRLRGYYLEDVRAWRQRVRAYLCRLVGEAPEAERELAN